ncbi:MAG: carbonic anhydrase, partial [Bdellovibrionales bacterium]
LMLSTALLVGFSAPVYAGEGAHWDYTNLGGAAGWGHVDEAFGVCDTGAAQSPINIDKFMQTDLAPLALAYQDAPLVVGNNGHSVQADYAAGSTLTLDGKAYTLKQLHFHTPSEHYIDGAPYPMEVHLVHAADDGALAVIGVMIKVGAHNPVIEGIWQNVPPAGDVKTVEGVAYNAADLLPGDKSYYSYEGSLTTPPCSEGVTWFVMKSPIELSMEQLKAFQSVFPVNARPIQPLGGRIVKGD